ncbi:GtrA family protein [uncultured Helicobacter sp.]|uniref:GtrA family protein n=1 Tax=uncultured Helicobacter sp. TaxID=175537 RepID=UPI00374F0903
MLVRYILVGCVATAIFYIVANVFAFFGGGYIATFMGNLVSFVFGYFAQMKYAFGMQPNHTTMLPKYIVTLCLIFGYGQFITFLSKDFSYIYVSLCIALSVPLFSYPLQKFWVFREVNDRDSQNISRGGGNRYSTRHSLVALYHHINIFFFLLFSLRNKLSYSYFCNSTNFNAFHTTYDRYLHCFLVGLCMPQAHTSLYLICKEFR